MVAEWARTPFYSGKVRDLYHGPNGEFVLVASDRLSAFDVVMAEPVPDKGRVLTAMTVFWLERFGDVVGTHLVSHDLDDLPGAPEEWRGRVMVCRRAEMLPIECIVRGYVAGSAWSEYRVSGTVCGEAVVPGLREADQLPAPILTPSTKADAGSHDVNISRQQAVELVGADIAARVEAIAVELYRSAAALTAAGGIILADTKFEFGLIDGDLVLCDEVITPDSSRFWPADQYEPGHSQPSYDKQPVRDYLAGLDWDRTPPPPPLPAEVVAATAQRYREAYERITGRSLDDWA